MTLLLCVIIAADIQSGMPLEQVLARRAYEPAVSYLLPTLEHDSTNARTMRTLARIYEHWHKYDSSVIWWNRALRLDPKHDSTITGRWQALYHRDEKDSARLAAAKQLIAQEARPYLAESAQRSLTLAYDGLSLSDSAGGVQAALLLTRLFPDSPRGYEIIGAMFYDSLYPVWTNDTAKVPIIRRFLERYPVTEWRQTFYTFLLSSLFGLKDTAQLRATASEMVLDDTLDPFRPRYAAALFNRLKFDPAQAEAYARKAIELEPSAAKPPNKPQEQWDLEYPVLYGQARLALAEALLAQGRLDEARSWLSDAKAEFHWDANSEWTPAPFYCLQGEIAAERTHTEEAVMSFGSAVSWGDSRNYWTARADSAVERLWGWTDRQLCGEYGTATEVGEGFPPVFTDVTDSFGLKGRRESRVAWDDYNNDGFDDLLLNGCRLFRNDSAKRFTDVTDSVGLAGAAGRGGVWADYDNDGWLDFWMSARSGLDRLWHNDSGRFRDATAEAGTPADSFPTEGAAWADLDNDGWVDLYCANYENWQQHCYHTDKLWRNECGRFTDWTDSGGIKPPCGIDLAGRGVAWADFDDDGYQDCFVSNYRLCENFLWHNNGDRTFENLAAQLGVSGDEVSGWYGHTIGAAWADYDNDGDLDLFTADLAHPRYIEFSNRSRLYENQGPAAYPRFRDRRAKLGIRYEETHSNPAWADVDNDGDQDLYITSIYEGRRSFLYENVNQGRQFRDITWLSGTRMFNGWGCAFADFDKDGDQDLVVGSGSGVKLFRNETGAAPADFNGSRRHWLEVKVVGTRANRAGIGARVTVRQGRSTWVREVNAGSGTTSQSSLVQHFGLGGSDQPVSVEVRFGPGSSVRLERVPVDQLLRVEEGPD